MSSLRSFQKKLEPKCRRELTSVSVLRSLQRSHNPGDPLADSLRCLAECSNLRESQLVMEFEDQHCFPLLRGLRGLKHVNIRTILQPHNIAADQPRWTIAHWLLSDKECIWREVGELNVLLLLPKRCGGNVI